MAVILERRSFIAGVGALGATALVSLPGCAGGLGAFTFVDAVRRLLTLSSSAALDRLIAPGGFYDNQVARLNLPDVFGSRGGVLANILTGVVFRDRLQRSLNDVADETLRCFLDGHSGGNDVLPDVLADRAGHV